jgi:SAM-dependent methyltransferase
MKYGEMFFDTYLKGATGKRIMDLGAQDVNGSLRSVAPPGNDYVGVDFCKAKGVDVVIEDPYSLPFEDGVFDACVTSSCFEHSEFFWLTFLEIARVVKKGGLLYLNVPSNGPFHRYPVDCWRFYPDSGAALQRWAERSGHQLTLLESFTGNQEYGYWNDFVAVFGRGEARDFQSGRMLDRAEGITNGKRSSDSPLINEALLPQDQDNILFKAKRKINARLGKLT